MADTTTPAAPASTAVPPPLWWSKQWTLGASAAADALWVDIRRIDGEQARVAALAPNQLTEADVQGWIAAGVPNLPLGPQLVLGDFVAPRNSLISVDAGGQHILTKPIFRAVELGEQDVGAMLKKTDSVFVDPATSTIAPQPLVAARNRRGQPVLSRPGLSVALTSKAAFFGAASDMRAKPDFKFIFLPNYATDVHVDPRMRDYKFRKSKHFMIWTLPAGTVINPALRIENDFDHPQDADDLPNDEKHVSVSAAVRLPATVNPDGTIRVQALEDFRTGIPGTPGWRLELHVFVCRANAEWPDWFFDQDDPSGIRVVVGVLEAVAERGSDEDFDDFCAINSALLSSPEKPAEVELSVQLVLMYTLIESASTAGLLNDLETDGKVARALRWISDHSSATWIQVPFRRTQDRAQRRFFAVADCRDELDVSEADQRIRWSARKSIDLASFRCLSNHDPLRTIFAQRFKSGDRAFCHLLGKNVAALMKDQCESFGILDCTGAAAAACVVVDFQVQATSDDILETIKASLNEPDGLLIPYLSLQFELQETPDRVLLVNDGVFESSPSVPPIYQHLDTYVQVFRVSELSLVDGCRYALSMYHALRAWQSHCMRTSHPFKLLYSSPRTSPLDFAQHLGSDQANEFISNWDFLRLQSKDLQRVSFRDDSFVLIYWNAQLHGFHSLIGVMLDKYGVGFRLVDPLSSLLAS
eukprot:m.15606 g.15606  ORF g.15606 m.15606 type:complete len:700 (-) comp25949_c0_seq1:198-2297(-)